MPDPLKKIESLAGCLEDLLLHVGRKDLEIGDRRINAQLYLTISNACLRNRAALLYGGLGANKTTLVNLLGCAFTGESFDCVEDCMITGHPEQTEEKILGFIDPRQWARPGDGKIEVLWTPWARSRWKVINEINRFPAGKQNIFLELLQKRKVSYAGEVLVSGDTCYFATMNPEFSSTYPLDEALLDRISLCIPASQPDFLAGLSLAGRDREVRDLAEELPRLSAEENAALPSMVSEVRLDAETELAILSLVRDFTLCERAPANDKTLLIGNRPSRGLCAGCHYNGNPEVCCWQVDGGLSDRARQDLRQFTRTLSLVATGGLAMPLDVLRAVAPYVIWHRVNPQHSILNRPPYYGVRRLQLVRDLIERSINRTLSERGEMNLIFSQAVDGEIPLQKAIMDLSEYDDPLARLDYLPALERMI